MTERIVTLFCTAPIVASALTALLTDAGWDVQPADGSHGSVVLVLVRTSSGIAEIREIRATHGHTPVVAITDYSDADLTAEVIESGATSVIPWDSDAATLVATMDLARQSALPSPRCYRPNISHRRDTRTRTALNNNCCFNNFVSIISCQQLLPQ